jgi:hypothetical protein
MAQQKLRPPDAGSNNGNQPKLSVTPLCSPACSPLIDRATTIQTPGSEPDTVFAVFAADPVFGATL